MLRKQNQNGDKTNHKTYINYLEFMETIEFLGGNWASLPEFPGYRNIVGHMPLPFLSISRSCR